MTNVARSKVVPGIQRRFIVGYIVRDNVTTTDEYVTDFGQRPRGTVAMMEYGR